MKQGLPDCHLRFRQKEKLIKEVVSIIDQGFLTELHILLMLQAAILDCRKASDVFIRIQ